MWPTPDYTFAKNCECQTHNSVLLWNNVCTCGWEFTATNTVDGSSIYNACSCAGGQSFVFNGTTTITATGPEALLIDQIFIWGHNITSALITVGPNGPSTNPREVGVTRCGKCDPGGLEPIVIDLVIPPIDSITDIVTITIESDGIICIDNLFIGRKLPITLSRDFQNPHDGTDCTQEIKESDCGPLTIVTERVEVPMNLRMQCVPNEWVADNWRCYLKWAKKYGFYFRWSINNAERDLFFGRLDGPQPPSTFGDFNMCTKNLQLNARGYITQPETKFLPTDG